MVVVSLPILLTSSAKRKPIVEKPKPSFVDNLSFSVSSEMPSIDASPLSEHDSVSERTHYFTTAKNLLITGSNAVERLMSSYKDIVELAGHTARVANMFTVLEEASRGVYHKTVVEKKEKGQGFEIEFRGDQPIAKGRVLHSDVRHLVFLMIINSLERFIHKQNTVFWMNIFGIKLPI